MEVYIVNKRVLDDDGTKVISAVYADTDFDAAVARAKELAAEDKERVDRLAVINDDVSGYYWDDSVLLWEAWTGTERVSFYIAGHGAGRCW